MPAGQAVLRAAGIRGDVGVRLLPAAPAPAKLRVRKSTVPEPRQCTATMSNRGGRVSAASGSAPCSGISRAVIVTPATADAGATSAAATVASSGLDGI